MTLHRYYKLLLWPITGSLHQSIHSCCGNTPPRKGPAEAAGFTFEPLPQVTVNLSGLPAGVSIVTCSGTRVGPRAPGRLADQGAPCSKGHSSDKVSHAANLLALLWRSRMVFYRRVATFHSNILFTKSAYTVEPVPFVQMSPLSHRMGCSMKLAHTCLMFR